MAMIRCSECGEEISDKAKRCPSCRSKLNKGKKLKVILMVFAIVAIIIAAIFGVKKYQEIKERQIKQILEEAEGYYNNFDFSNILECYEQLDKLHYDTTNLREIVKYDQEVYEVTATFYKVIKDVDTRLHNGNYSSLRSLIDTLKEPMEKFDELEINTDSKIGTYIDNVRENVIYSGLKTEYVTSNKYDLDYGLTSWGFAYAIEGYTEILVAEEFPYTMEE